MDDKLLCRNTELLMNDFIEHRLVGDDLWDFLNHLLTCPACYEELETKYLLSEALIRLENGETIELEKELKSQIIHSRRSLRLHRFCDCVYRTLEIISVIVVAFFLGGFIEEIFKMYGKFL